MPPGVNNSANNDNNSCYRPHSQPKNEAENKVYRNRKTNRNQSKKEREGCQIKVKGVSYRRILRVLDAAGRIKLPEKLRNGPPKGGADQVVLMLHDMVPVEGILSELTSLVIEAVTDKEKLIEPNKS